jgi:hypothetical protein
MKMLKKSWKDSSLRGDRTLRSYRDHFNNHPYQKLVTRLSQNWPGPDGDLYTEKRKRYGRTYSRRYSEFGSNMHTRSRNSAHYSAPEYSFYGYNRDLEIDGLLYDTSYSVNFYDEHYYVTIEPHFAFPGGKWKINLPMHTRMNEESITAFITSEVRKVIMPAGAMQDLQVYWLKLPLPEFKEWLRANCSFAKKVERDKLNKNYNESIVRRLRSKHNIRASATLRTETLLNLLKTYKGRRFSKPTATVSYRDVHNHMSYFDGDVDEIESYINEEFGDTIII